MSFEKITITDVVQVRDDKGNTRPAVEFQMTLSGRFKLSDKFLQLQRTFEGLRNKTVLCPIRIGSLSDGRPFYVLHGDGQPILMADAPQPSGSSAPGVASKPPGV